MAQPSGSTESAGGTATAVAARVVGQHGNTSKGRLDRLDALLELYEPALFTAPSASAAAAVAVVEVCVDVGFGDAIDTYRDFAARLSTRRVEGTLRVVGTESDAGRLAAGKSSLGDDLRDSSLALRLGEAQGWFVLPLEEPEAPPVFIRALNVLRDYHPSDALRGLQTLGAQLAPGGLLMEGSASTPGHTSVVALVRRGLASQPSVTADTAGMEEGYAALRLEALCFCVDFERRDAPKLKGASNRWFTRQIPQLWQHQHTKAAPAAEHVSEGDIVTCGGNTVTSDGDIVAGGGGGTGKKRKRGGDRKWLGGGGCVATRHSHSLLRVRSFRNRTANPSTLANWLVCSCMHGALY